MGNTLLAQVWWVADLLTNFRVQMGIGIIASMVVLAFKRRWVWLLVGLVLLGFNGWRILPYLSPVEKHLSSSQTYKMLTTNVLTSNGEHEKLIELIRVEQPDFVVVMEINDRWVDALAELGDLFPHVEAHPREHNFGIGILSLKRWEEIEVPLFAELPWIKARFNLDGKSFELNAVGK